jgi:hypothetical protein
MRKLLAAVLFAVPATCLAQAKPHVLVISIDGMRPDYVTAADAHGLKIPTLRAFLHDGAYADGVQGVIPTFTFPSHTTLMTGAWPNVHGVHNNTRFDPEGTLNNAPILEYSTIKVPTLWGVAKRAGYTVATVGWPVTTHGDKDFDYLMPANPTFEGGDTDGATGVAEKPGEHLDHPAGLREQFASSLPPNPEVDDKRFAWTMEILKRYKPTFMTTHLVNLDHQEHLHGPFSAEANASLEVIDGEVAKIIALERSIDPRAYIVIVSDHGFFPIEQRVNLGVLFVKAGLIRMKGDKGAEVASWDAQLWNSGGTAAAILHDPKDEATKAKVKALLDEAAKDPAYNIAKVLTTDQVAKLGGGYPEAAFVVEFKSGTTAGGARRGEVVAAAPGTGTHGFLPQHPELRASFLITGPDVAKGRDLGVIDMRQIGPTLAKIMQVKLPAATEPPVHYAK